MSPRPVWWWPLLSPGWLLSLVSLGGLQNNGVEGGTVNVGPYIQTQAGGGGGGGASNQLSSTIGDFSVSWVGIGVIATGGSAPSHCPSGDSQLPAPGGKGPSSPSVGRSPISSSGGTQARSYVWPQSSSSGRSRPRTRVTVIQ